MMQQRALLAPKHTLSSGTLRPRTCGRVPVREMRVRQKVSVPAVKRDEEGRLVDDDGWVVGFTEEAGLSDEELQEVYERAKADIEARQRAEAARNQGAYTPDAARSALLGDVQGSHYQFMGISPNAENADIRSAYRTLSKLYHPDTTQLDRKEANDLFIRLQDSYEILSDSEKRRYYDWKLSLEITAASRETGETQGFTVTETGRRVYSTSDPAISAMDKLGVDESLPLSNQATFSLFFDLGAFGFALGVIALGCWQAWQ